MDERIKRDIKWYTKHRTKIWGTIWFIAGIVGGNTDRLYSELSKPLSSDSRIDALYEDLEILEGRVLRLETEKDGGKMPLWSGSIIL